MLWAITCVDNRDTAVLREQQMQVHRAYLDRQKSILVLGGATLTDNGEQATGNLFIINVGHLRPTHSAPILSNVRFGPSDGVIGRQLVDS